MVNILRIGGRLMCQYTYGLFISQFHAAIKAVLRKVRWHPIIVYFFTPIDDWVLLTYGGGDTITEQGNCNNTSWKTLLLFSCNSESNDNVSKTHCFVYILVTWIFVSCRE